MNTNSNSVGLGVKIGMLSDNLESANAVQSSIGHIIAHAALTHNEDSGADELVLGLDDNSTLTLFDSGQSCCERRYARTDDTLSDFVGARLVSVEVREAADLSTDDGMDAHEMQFLVVSTDRGAIIVATHNEHNGYYGGFWIAAKKETNDAGTGLGS